MSAPRRVRTTCCIAGGGPAGMMLGYILARAGVPVLVLEKHADFLRDFRGDTVHPSTMEALWELGLLERFLQRPHEKVETLTGQVGDDVIHAADFRRIPAHARFVALMPQWDFLDFLSSEGRRFPEFRVLMSTEALDLVRDGEAVTGVAARDAEGEFVIEADLVVAADGRTSVLRDKAGLQVEDFGAPMDVLWLRLPRRDDDPAPPLGRIDDGRIFVTLPRNGYFQCAFVVAKGEDAAIRAAGLPAFRASVARLAPLLADRVDTIASWDEVKLLTVTVDRLRQWATPGLLCIGDAAHAMSPVGGVGINLAIQDSVAAANAVAGPLKAGRPSLSVLNQVQAWRDQPTRRMQRLQLTVQNAVIGPTLASGARRRPRAPWPAKLLNLFPPLRQIPARIMGLGFRLEHVRTPDVH